MSDKKLSSLPNASALTGREFVYVVQSGGSFKATVANLFASTANVGFISNVAFTGVETVSAPGAINVNVPTTKLVGDGAGGTCTIAAGKIEGAIKYISYVSGTGSYVVNSRLAANANLTFSNVGHTATLMFLSNVWHMMGGTATLS